MWDNLFPFLYKHPLSVHFSGNRTLRTGVSLKELHKLLNKGFSIKSRNYFVGNNKGAYHRIVKLFSPIVHGEEVKIHISKNSRKIWLKRLSTGIRNVLQYLWDRGPRGWELRAKDKSRGLRVEQHKHPLLGTMILNRLISDNQFSHPEILLPEAPTGDVFKKRSYLKELSSTLLSSTPVRCRNPARSSHGRCSVRKGVLRNFEKLTGKHLRQSLLFDKFAGQRPATLLKKRVWQRRFPMNFAKFLRTPFLQNTSGRLLYPVSWHFNVEQIHNRWDFADESVD